MHNIENYPLGHSLTFTPDDDVEVEFRPAAISVADARVIGMTYCESDDEERDAMLAVLGGRVVRRTLRVFANTAVRLGDADAAAFAQNLRDEITTATADTEAVA